ncbi:PrpF family protein [Sphaerisporangium album]|uniref:PrpF family protein n=1 Tax=Sphaerisporangium album TaxID=509200 RepID=A0A367F7U9_9ACTN|nr:PrpF domain-containing protein [Sphaerisporangium album]RCG25932.1 PrpF family protein [Sphaerisporangium album]
MPQRLIPAVFMRGGTSKGLFFHERDLPADAAARDMVLLRALGSPDPYGRQLDGMGGGISSLSKAAIIAPPTRPDADVDYTFAQIAVDAPIVDYGANCGNLSAAVGPFAVDEGLCPRPDGEALVRIHNTNTGKVIHARFAVRDRRAVVDGDLAVPGVPGTGSPVRLDFLDPAGSRTAGLLPTGRPVDELRVGGRGVVRASLVDAANPLVIVAAPEAGLLGVEHPDELEADGDAMRLLDQVRRAAGVLMGLGASPADVPLSNPKVAVVAPAQDFRTLAGELVRAADHDLTVRMLSMGRAHRAVTVTGALCLGVAGRVPGTVAFDLLTAVDGPVRLGNPSGVVVTDAVMEQRPGGPHPASAALLRTARRLMQGQVVVPTPEPPR